MSSRGTKCDVDLSSSVGGLNEVLPQRGKRIHVQIDQDQFRLITESDVEGVGNRGAHEDAMRSECGNEWSNIEARFRQDDECVERMKTVVPRRHGLLRMLNGAKTNKSH